MTACAAHSSNSRRLHAMHDNSATLVQDHAVQLLFVPPGSDLVMAGTLKRQLVVWQHNPHAAHRCAPHDAALRMLQTLHSTADAHACMCRQCCAARCLYHASTDAMMLPASACCVLPAALCCAVLPGCSAATPTGLRA